MINISLPLFYSNNYFTSYYRSYACTGLFSLWKRDTAMCIRIQYPAYTMVNSPLKIETKDNFKISIAPTVTLQSFSPDLQISNSILHKMFKK